VHDTRAVPRSEVIAVFGPTAVGKTSVVLALAGLLRELGEDPVAVSADALQVYSGLETLTGAPTASERGQLEHRLISLVGVGETFSAGRYAELAHAEIDELLAAGRRPIVVGGTGLYLRALLEGLFPGPQRSEELRERLRDRAERKGPRYLHEILRHLDAEAAGKIHANDIPKLIRAIEVCLTSRQKMTEMWKQGRDPLSGFRILRLGLNPNRDALYPRINRRAQHMFDAGLVEETRRLLAKYGDGARPLSTLGYKQAAQLLRGEIDANTALQLAQQAHRNYAKRQMTWFRREPGVTWLEGFGDDPAIQQRAVLAVEA